MMFTSLTGIEEARLITQLYKIKGTFGYRFICRHLWYFFWCWLQIRIPFFSYTSHFRRVARLIFSVIFTILVVIAAIFDIKSKMSDFFMTEKSVEVAFYTVETLFSNFFEWFRLARMSYSKKWKKNQNFSHKLWLQ